MIIICYTKDKCGDVFRFTFQSSDEVGTVSQRISTCFHAVSTTWFVVPLTALLTIVVVTENGCKKKEGFYIQKVLNLLIHLLRYF